eukprot:scaffold462341_cov19-Prasinocladus_malaysianus.AAC.1
MQICADHTARGTRITAMSFGHDGSVLAVAAAGPRHNPQQMVPDMSDRSEGLIRMYSTTGWGVGE